MLRRLSSLLLITAVACGGTAPSNGDSRPAAAGSTQVAEVGKETTTPSKSPSSSGPAANVPAPDPREAALAEVVLELMEKEHLLRKHIDDSMSREAFKTYLDRVDGSKMFLLKSDRDALAKYEDKIDDEMRSGSFDLAHDTNKLFAARVAVVDKMVAEILASPMDHSDEEYLELDPKKVQPAATDAELRDRWRKRLELEVMEKVAQMESRLDLDKELKKKKEDAKKGKPAAKPAPASGSAAPPSAVPPSASLDDDDEEKVTTPIAQIPTTPEGREQKAKEDLAKQYAGRFARLRHPGKLDAAADLINALTATLDPHTTYMPPADKANFDIHMSGSLEGIGAVLREREHYIEVAELVPGGASWRQGKLAAGDLILSVAAEGKEAIDVVDMRIDEVVKMIRGPKGTVVTLRVQKSTGVQEAITITRDVVVVEETYARGAILQRKTGASYGYIHLPSFYGGKGSKRSAAVDVRRLLLEMKARKVGGVIIDIRSNGGGLLNDAVDMTGSLIDQGPVVQVQDSRGRRETLSDEHKGTDYDGAVVVMVDRFSASASEIVAAALQDYGRAVIVGTGPTHGKGTVQTLADLDRATGGKVELGVLKITFQQFFRVNGGSTQREGVTPDILLPDPAGHVETGERELEHAIAWSSVPAVPHDMWSATWKIPTLAQRSKARVEKQPAFSEIAKLSQIMKARRADTKVPLAKATWEKRRKDQKAEVEAATPDLKGGTAKFTVTSVDEPSAASAGGKDDKLSRWRDSLSKDIWVDEAMNILGDMTKS
ncbi:MAG: carboxy terminal-processing peptidase [Deltaproteobacteria bacterium]|nr:carboxy terminal-processing peptidase [Deltaproteobacteria bacterium]MCW5804345.1 carboxy terminal-processing peptidase [Deltaproteobacteria bacterium]